MHQYHYIEKYSKQIVENELANKKAIAELTAYNNSGSFLHEHDYFANRNRLAELRKLKETEPEEFMKHIVNVNNYLIKYKNGGDKFEKYKNEFSLIKQII